MRLTARNGFSILVLVFFCYLVWEAGEWRLQARLYPWAIGIPMIFLALLNIVQEFRGPREKEEGAAQNTPSDFQFTQPMDMSVAVRRTITILSWIVGFLAGIWLVGFSITVAAMTFGFLKIQSKEGWPMSLILTASAWLIYYIVFERTLLLPFPEGQIFRWLGIE
ncbi:MAG: tripartite tricarboxylate transporter TctB family protein [Deltaproteobacteria bacterium]|nr:tripartite tricarboxylate transporter TctB family protein [Deltaproteobacteria bacterium]